jgi:hypothetical protein
MTSAADPARACLYHTGHFIYILHLKKHARENVEKAAQGNGIKMLLLL